jgi:hypothetical protein
MFRALSAATLATLIFVAIEVIVVPGRTAANLRAAKSDFSNQVVIDGLHIARPQTMRDFPMEFVPRP